MITLTKSMLGREVLLSKSNRPLPNFSIFVCLISFALLGSFILSKGGRDESALQNNYSLSPHSKCSKIIYLFAVGEAFLEKKSGWEVNFVHTTNERQKWLSRATLSLRQKDFK
jgi:hypothetical protein